LGAPGKAGAQWSERGGTGALGELPGGWSQYVVYGGHESERGKVECGVPPGSVLYPLFFLLHVNDIERACRGLDLVLFMDDKHICGGWGPC